MPVVMGAVVLGAVAAGALVIVTGAAGWAVALLILGLAAGLLLVLPVGGADVPIVISLLNAFTGLAVAASGIVLGNVLLLVAGTLVGASGTILTKVMASAMGRGVTGIMFGAFREARRRDPPCRATGRFAPPRPRTSPSSSATRSGW